MKSFNVLMVERYLLERFDLNRIKKEDIIAKAWFYSCNGVIAGGYLNEVMGIESIGFNKAVAGKWPEFVNAQNQIFQHNGLIYSELLEGFVGGKSAIVLIPEGIRYYGCIRGFEIDRDGDIVELQVQIRIGKRSFGLVRQSVNRADAELDKDRWFNVRLQGCRIEIENETILLNNFTQQRLVAMEKK